MAYLDKSKGGANFIKLNCEDADGNTHRQDIYFTNRNGEEFYVKDGEKNYLPGYNQLNSMSMLICEKPLKGLPSEEKTVNVYDFEQKKEIPLPKEVIMEWINKPIKLGILNILDDKNVKNSDGSALSAPCDTVSQ